MRFRDLSIRRKLTLLILASSVLGLVMACVGLAAYERKSFRASTTNELSALADTLGANAVASMVFNDQKTAADILGALRTEPHILGARLYDANGKVFAEYRRPNIGAEVRMPSWRPDGAAFTPDSLVLFRSVAMNGEKAGSIAIVSDLTGFRAKIVEYTKIAAFVLLISLLATYLVSSRLLSIATAPILKLAELAETVSVSEDFTLRGTIQSRDEVGTLVAAFNDMLERIQQRDAALQKLNAELEGRVEKRTAELSRAKDAAEEANRAKSEFLANMSHEIRTPLNGVIGMTELALETQLTSEQQEYLDTVKLSGDALLTVINDILDFSKIEAGKLDFESIEFNVRESIEAGLKALAIRAHERGLKLNCSVRPEVPTVLVGDPSRLRQVIVNLVGNAIKFTDRGEVTVDVQVDSAEPSSALLRVSVMDTGVGIPQEKQSSIFDAFTQADGSTARRYGGSGLGLTISRRLVEMFGGRLWLDSSVGKGSTFHFTALFGVPAVQITLPPPVIHRSAPEAMKPLRILLAEDNRVNQIVVVRLMEKRGHSVEVASNGREALEKFRLGGFDLLLMDVQMPQMDGFEATAAIREIEKSEAAHIPIIAMTAHAMKGDRERCLAAGMDGYISKPFQIDELMKEIERLPQLTSAIV